MKNALISMVAMGLFSGVLLQAQEPQVAKNQNFNKVIEAESLVDKSKGIHKWEVKDHQLASGGKMLMCDYGDSMTYAITKVTIPADKEYIVWVRYYNIPEYRNVFSIDFTDKDENETISIKYGDLKNHWKKYPAEGFIWQRINTKLPAGELTLKLWKDIGMPPYTYRRIDKIVITDDAEWKPE